jgi:hypothetical protein
MYRSYRHLRNFDHVRRPLRLIYEPGKQVSRI